MNKRKADKIEDLESFLDSEISDERRESALQEMCSEDIVAASEICDKKIRVKLIEFLKKRLNNKLDSLVISMWHKGYDVLKIFDGEISGWLLCEMYDAMNSNNFGQEAERMLKQKGVLEEPIRCLQFCRDPMAYLSRFKWLKQGLTMFLLLENFNKNPFYRDGTNHVTVERLIVPILGYQHINKVKSLVDEIDAMIPNIESDYIRGVSIVYEYADVILKTPVFALRSNEYGHAGFSAFLAHAEKIRRGLKTINYTQEMNSIVTSFVHPDHGRFKLLKVLASHFFAMTTKDYSIGQKMGILLQF